MPEGFEIFDTSATPYFEYVCFIDKSTGQNVSLSQYVKSNFGTMHLNTENHQIGKVDVKGHKALCIEFGGREQIGSGMLWDNGDYILEVGANSPKNEVINLVNSNEIGWF